MGWIFIKKGIDKILDAGEIIQKYLGILRDSCKTKMPETYSEPPQTVS